MVTLAVAFPLCVCGAQARQQTILVSGLELDSKAFRDSLASPFWRALAAAPCATPAWHPDLSSQGTLRASTQPLRRRLIAIAGSPLPSAGALLKSVTVYRGSRYIVERVLITSRIPNTATFAYVVRQSPMGRKTAAVVLLHGSGMQPLEALGWNVDNFYRAGERSSNAAFIAAALEFAEAGYTVYMPWLADNGQSAAWQQLSWATLEENGAALRARIKGLGPYNFVVNEVAAGADYLSTLADVDIGKLAIVGWKEGAQIGAITAALDERFAAVVRLAAPIDRQRLRATVDGVMNEAHFTHADCGLGDQELAALLAPRALLYAYSTKDESVSRVARFVSLPLATSIRELYKGLRQPKNFHLQGDTTWSLANSRRVRSWVDSALSFVPRAVPAATVARQPQAPPSQEAWRDTTQANRQGYSTTLGTCVARSPRADLTSVGKFLKSVEPFRRGLATDLGIPLPASGRAITVRRTPIATRPGYSVEFVQIQSKRTPILISGLLAIPNTGAAKHFPAIVSADGNAGLATPFGLMGRERTPYLNAYGDALAATGTIVFVPYFPVEFPEIAAVELAARTNGQTSFTYIVPMLSAAADLLLSMPEVDSTKVGIWGVSFGGFAALYAAALDTRFSSVVFSNPVVTADVLFGTQTSSSLAAWWPEVCQTIDAVQAYLIAPRRFLRENGLRDANGYERTPLESIDRIRQVYNSLGVGSEFIFVRHDGGHETRPREVKPYLP